MTHEEIFVEAVSDRLPEDFRRHFLTRMNVVYPEMPKPTSAGRRNADAVLKNRFELIGETFDLEENFSWKTKRTADKEWQIAHHKFYFAVDLIHAWRDTKDARYLKKWVSLLDSWLNEIDSGFITASDAQVEAKRIEHWVYSFSLLHGTSAETEISPDFLKRFLSRIATETDYITHHLKRVRNHRTFQLFAVVLVGVLFPEFKLHDDFLKAGVEKLTENLLTDILSDGVQVEQSSHYHQLVVETAVAFTEVTRLNNIELSEAFLDRLHAGLRFSMYLQWPTAEIPLINDSDNGNHLALLLKGAALFDDDHLLWAGTLGKAGKPPEAASTHFGTSGYFILGDHWGTDPASYQRRQHVFYDCGRLGEGSHSQYDLFNFTYFVGGQAVIIDPGRYTYDSEPDKNGIDWRHYFKSTACHNTVTIDAKNQTRYISREERKRLALKEKHGPDVKCIEKDWAIGKHSDWITAVAKSEEYTPRHSRDFIYILKGYLFIFDRIEMGDDGPHRTDLHFHLTDSFLGKVVLDQRGDTAIFKTPAVEIRSDCYNRIAASIERGWVSREYGVKTEAPVVKLSQIRSDTSFFASTISQVTSGETGTALTAFKRMDLFNGHFLHYRVEGVCDSVPFFDHYFFHKNREVGPLHFETLSCRARFLALRTDQAGRIIHLIGQSVSAFECEEVAGFKLSEGGHIEWKR